MILENKFEIILKTENTEVAIIDDKRAHYKIIKYLTQNNINPNKIKLSVRNTLITELEMNPKKLKKYLSPY